MGLCFRLKPRSERSVFSKGKHISFPCAKADSRLHLQVLEHEQAYLAALPSAQMYEKSFMHRDTVTQVAVAQDQDFLLTGSIDGHLKFWKKTPTGIEFAKHYRAHVGSLDGA